MGEALKIVMMGVSGCGKSTVGRALAQALGLRFVEGDDLHPPANVARMAAGQPLDDAARAPWLDAVAAELAAPGPLVLTCSALRRRYRDRLRAAAPGLRLVFLHGRTELLAQRLQARRHHYMPVSLLQSQLDALEPPDADEAALAVDIGDGAPAIVERLCLHFGGACATGAAA